jgi:LuxR family maltose regulon positive regulatory protein
MEAQLEIQEYLNRHVIHDIETGWFYAHTGQPHKLAAWLRNEFEESELNSIFHHFEILVKAKCLYAEKEYDAALDLLTFEENRKSLGSYLLGLMEMSALEAVTRYCLGDTEGAVKVLEKAWEAGSPNNLDMPFVELGEDMRLLLGEAMNLGCSLPREWLESTRSRASAYGKKLFLVTEQLRQEEKPGGNPAVYLTRRERLVLRELSRGLTREDIAEEHNLTLNMVKSLISALYAKLGALNRADAIRIATGMGLLDKSEI